MQRDLVKRPDAAELLSIRQGAWSYERLIGWARDQDAKMGRQGVQDVN